MGENGSMTQRWRELSGENNWAGLLDPFDLDLRMYIILYGDLAAAIVTGLNDEKASKWYGFCRYSEKDFLSKVGLNREIVPMYEVTKYIYATSDIPEVREKYIPKSNVPDAEDLQAVACMGFVAVSTEMGTARLGRRDIVVVWRGTIDDTQSVETNAVQTSAAPIFGNANDPKVHLGWYSLYTSKATGPLDSTHGKSISARDQVHDEITRLMNLYGEDPEMSITIVGYSMGSALATLNAVDLANGYYALPSLPTARKDILISAFLFGSPRVGDQGFKDVFDGLENLHALRIANERDKVLDSPQTDNSVSPVVNYVDVGQVLQIKTYLSPYLKISLKRYHPVQIYLHGVAGTDGDKFDLKVNRSVALVNTSLAALDNSEFVIKYRVPDSWWVRENKGMVLQENGLWKLLDFHPYDE